MIAHSSHGLDTIPAFVLATGLAEAVRAEGSAPHARFVEVITRHQHIGPTFDALTQDDPGYLSDLRMKRYPDPEAYFLEHALPLLRQDRYRDLLYSPSHTDYRVRSLRSMAGAVESQVREYQHDDLVRQLAPNDCLPLAQTLWCYVNYLGSWDDGEAISRSVFEQRNAMPHGHSAARLLALAGSIFAISMGDVRYRELYREALEQSDSGNERFLILMRTATVELKRFGDLARARAALDLAAGCATNLKHHGYTPEDSVFSTALMENLAALLAMRSGDPDGARRRVELSWELMEGCSNERLSIRESAANRYRVMVLENLALLHALLNNWKAAVEGFARAVEFAQKHDPKSESEALSMYGIALWKWGDCHSALDVLQVAETMLGEDVSPPRLQAVRELLAVVCDDLGDDKGAAKWLSLVRSGNGMVAA